MVELDFVIAVWISSHRFLSNEPHTSPSSWSQWILEWRYLPEGHWNIPETYTKYCKCGSIDLIKNHMCLTPYLFILDYLYVVTHAQQVYTQIFLLLIAQQYLSNGGNTRMSCKISIAEAVISTGTAIFVLHQLLIISIYNVHGYSNSTWSATFGEHHINREWSWLQLLSYYVTLFLLRAHLLCCQT